MFITNIVKYKSLYQNGPQIFCMSKMDNGNVQNDPQLHPKWLNGLKQPTNQVKTETKGKDHQSRF